MQSHQIKSQPFSHSAGQDPLLTGFSCTARGLGFCVHADSTYDPYKGLAGPRAPHCLTEQVYTD